MIIVGATRYVTPLHEGGSLPAIVEGDDDGMYVLKFRGAGQGARALIAELVSGELARALGLPVPEIVLVDLDPELARTEPDPEISALIRASAGLNLALDYLPGSVMFDPLAEKPAADLGSRIVWFDALVTNVDRTARNTNMLTRHSSRRGSSSTKRGCWRWIRRWTWMPYEPTSQPFPWCAAAAPRLATLAGFRSETGFDGWCRRAARSSRCRRFIPDGRQILKRPWSVCSTPWSGAPPEAPGDRCR